MDLNNRIEGPEDRAELRRRAMRMEHRREPLIGTSEPLLDDRDHLLLRRHALLLLDEALHRLAIQ